MKYLKLILGLLFFSILLGGCQKSVLKTPVTMSFLACQDADITLIQHEEFTILIDTGENTCKEEVETYLENKKISKIDLMILSHPDKDHIGNAVTIMEKWKVEKVYAGSYQKDSKLEQELLDYIEEHQVDYEVLNSDKNIKIGELEILIEPPKKEYDSSNNNSLIVYMKIGNIRTFFGADIKRKRIEDVDALKSEIVKLPYHGRYIKNLEDLLKQLKPEYVIITSEEPEKETLELLEKMGIPYEETKQNIEIQIDGNTWKRGV